jgi:thymidine phosphorylase
MVRLGGARGVGTTALVTGMDAPLGLAVGNGLEAKEALRCLGGSGPDDLSDLSASLVGEMLFLGGVAESPEGGTRRAREALDQGRAAGRMARLVELQGGDPRVVEDPDLIPGAPEVLTVHASRSGFVQGVSPVSLGYGVVELGGGRRKMGDPVDLRVGFVLEVVSGDRVEAGQPLGEIHAADVDGLQRGAEILREAITLGPEPLRRAPLATMERISGVPVPSPEPSNGRPTPL